MQAKLVNTAGSDVDSRERTNSNDTNPGRHVKKRRAARKSLSGKTKMNTACLYYLYLSTINNYLHVLPNHKKPLISQHIRTIGANYYAVRYSPQLTEHNYQIKVVAVYSYFQAKICKYIKSYYETA